jgi:hypothetical protein
MVRKVHSRKAHSRKSTKGGFILGGSRKSRKIHSRKSTKGGARKMHSRKSTKGGARKTLHHRRVASVKNMTDMHGGAIVDTLINVLKKGLSLYKPKRHARNIADVGKGLKRHTKRHTARGGANLRGAVMNMTVADLKKHARAMGHRIPAGARKADLLKLVK